MDGLLVDDGLTLPAESLSWTAVRASGPGGQHVNKTATAVELRFDPAGPWGLHPDAIARIRRLAGHRCSDDGAIRIVAMRFRSQARNLADARDRLAALLARARLPPAIRTATRVPPAERRARLADKRLRGARKRDRADRGGRGDGEG